MIPLAELEEVFPSVVVVEHAGREFRLAAPSLADGTALVREWAIDADRAGDEDGPAAQSLLRAMVRAVALTLQVEGGEMSRELCERLVLQTGMLRSRIGNAALMLCGMPETGAGEVPREDDLPT